MEEDEHDEGDHLSLAQQYPGGEEGGGELHVTYKAYDGGLVNAQTVKEGRHSATARGMVAPPVEKWTTAGHSEQPHTKFAPRISSAEATVRSATCVQWHRYPK